MHGGGGERARSNMFACVPDAMQRLSAASQNRDRHRRNAIIIRVTAPAQQRTTDVLRCIRGTEIAGLPRR